MKQVFRQLLCLGIVLCICLSLVDNVFAANTAGGKTQKSVEVSLGEAKLKVEAYADDIIRVRYSPDGEFAPKDFNNDEYIYTFVDPKAELEPVDLQVIEDEEIIQASTTKVNVVADKDTGAVCYYDKDGRLLLNETKRTAELLNGTETAGGAQPLYKVSQSFASPEAERLYGFGNVNDNLGLKGTPVTIRQRNTEKRSPMFVSSRGYGILFDITSNGALSWESQNSVYTYTGNRTDSIDYYFFYGPDADEVIEGYRTVTGAAALLPRNAFGYTQSRNRYGSQDELVSVVNQFRDKNIPIDNIVVDYFWWSGSFNNITQPGSNFKDLAGMMEKLHKSNVSASISVWPCFGTDNPTAKVLTDQYPEILVGQPGGWNNAAVYDPSREEYRNAYWDLINEYVFGKGLDSIWLDANEPESSNWSTNEEMKIAFGDSRSIGTIYSLLDNKAVYEGQRSAEGNTKRVNTLSRNTTAGIQRYGVQSWSGDIQTGFNSLKNEIKGVLNYSASGLPFFSTDTGGYFPFNSSNASDREMFLRWLQFSTFNSIMRVHGENAGGSNNREPWSFGSEYEGYIVDYINLRERLIPYTYTLAGKTAKDGYTMVRPLVFNFREDQEALDVQDQFMFGPAFMVCPVYTLGGRFRSVYLPEGKWIDFWSGASVSSSGESFTVDAPLSKIPLFVKAGSIVPMGPFIQYATEKSDPTEIRVYMGADGAFTLYEDEGDNYNYENGMYSEIPFQWDEESRTLTIGKRLGGFDGSLENRTFNIVFVQTGYGTGLELSEEYQAAVVYTGEEVSVTFDPNWEIPLPALDPNTLPKPEAAPDADPIEKSMVGDWKFDEGEGARLKDSSGSFNDGELVMEDPAIAWGFDTSKHNAALNFTGNENTYVQIKNSDSLQISDEVTFSAWIHPRTGSSDYRFIVAKGGNDSNNPGFCLMLTSNTGNQLQLEIQSPRVDGKTQKTTVTTAKGLIPYDEWTHVAFTWKSTDIGGDGKAKLYVNGTVQAEAVFEGPIGVNDETLNIGRNSTNNANYPLGFYGIIDEVQLYNYALEQDDITKLANFKTITVQNPRNITTTPGNNSITLKWTDCDEASLDHIKISYTPDTGGETIEEIVSKGVGELVIPDLNNGAYYQMLLQTVLNDGRTSYGTRVVGMANAVSAKLEKFVTYDSGLYGYVVNHSSTEVKGSMVVTVLENDTVVNKVTVENLVVSGMDMLQVRANIGPYKDKQKVSVEFVDTEGNPLTDCIVIERVYVPQLEPIELEKKLLTINAKREGKFAYGYDSEIGRNLIPCKGAMIHYENVPTCNYITISYSAEADTSISILKNDTELKTVPLDQTSGKYRTAVVRAAFEFGDKLTLFKKTDEADAAISYIILHQSDPTIIIPVEENVVLNKPLTVSGEDSQYPAYKAVDGIINNKQDFWRGTNRTGTAISKEDPGWMIADLKGSYHINSMTIQLPTHWGGRYQDIRVLASVDDGKTYKILSDWQTYEFKPAEAVTIAIPEDGFDATNLKLEFANNTEDPKGAQIGEWTVMGVQTTIWPKYPFIDVSEGDWFYKAVKFVYECGYMTGTSDSLFAPNVSLARDMVVTTLYRIEGKPASTYNGTFADVANGQWYTEAVEWAAANGIVNGYANGNFGPGDKITREQSAAILYRYAEYKEYDVSKTADLSRFTDQENVSEFAKKAMEWAVGTGIISGRDNGTVLDPQGSANRAECAAIIMRFMETYK